MPTDFIECPVFCHITPRRAGAAVSRKPACSGFFLGPEGIRQGHREEDKVGIGEGRPHLQPVPDEELAHKREAPAACGEAPSTRGCEDGRALRKRTRFPAVDEPLRVLGFVEGPLSPGILEQAARLAYERE